MVEIAVSAAVNLGTVYLCAPGVSGFDPCRAPRALLEGFWCGSAGRRYLHDAIGLVALLVNSSGRMFSVGRRCSPPTEISTRKGVNLGIFRFCPRLRGLKHGPPTLLRHTHRVQARRLGWAQVEASRSTVEAMLRARPRFHALMRLAARASTLEALGSRRRRRHALAMAACAAVDVATYRGLNTGSDPHLKKRLAADLLDVALWAEALDVPFDAATLGVTPLGIEAGLRFGFAAVGIPVLEALAVSAWRKLRGKPTGWQAFVWQVVAVATGWGLRSYQIRSLGSAEARFDRELSAQESYAFLSGQASVALGADTVVDRLWSIAPLLAEHASTSAALDARALQEWKASLGEQLGGAEVFLGHALLRWEKRNNDTPRLDRDVVVRVAPGHGTVVVSAGQALELESKLDRLGLHGRVVVSVGDMDEAAVPGAPRHLVVNGIPIEVSADPMWKAGPVDPAAVILGLGALWQLLLASDSYGGAPLATVLPWAAAMAGLAWKVHTEPPGDRNRRHGRILSAVLAISAGCTVVTTPRLRRPADARGKQHYPFFDVGSTAVIVAGLYWPFLKPLQRAGFVAGSAALAAVGVASLQQPARWRQLALEPLWLIAEAIPAKLMSVSYETFARELDERFATTISDRMRSAVIDGRRSIIEAVRSARSSLDDVTADLDGPTQLAVKERLARADELLEALLADA